MNQLLAQRLRELFCYDPATGIFTSRVTRGKWEAGRQVGSKHKRSGYIYIYFDGARYFAHRLAWLYVHGEVPDEKEVDHIDLTPDHNWIGNLRLASKSQNMQNQKAAHRNSGSGLLGVSWDSRSKCWRAQIKVDGRQLNLGTSASPHEAHALYVAAKTRLHPFSTIGLRA